MEIVEAIQPITRNISLIENTAYQIKILALNASMEAVRSGEQDKRFILVAEKVGALTNY